MSGTRLLLQTSKTLKVAKEHEIEFNNNPNYVIYVTPKRFSTTPAIHSRNKLYSLKEEKDVKDDSANFTTAWSFVISFMASNNDI